MTGTLLAILFAASPHAEEAEHRVALVIGNGDYLTIEALANPTNDAGDVAAALENLGFDVFLGLNARQNEMRGLIGHFVDAARSADVALFYYAGHGFQVDARNYLLPIDAVIRGREDVESQTIELNQITSALEGTAASSLIFLDACRDNPLDGTGETQGGLARIGDAAGFMFAFATQPDNVAYDGVGRNSFFTEALLSHMNTPGEDIASIMISVRKDVLAATGGRQVPWENSSLTREFQFVPGDATASPETTLWQLAASGQDPELMRIYVERYPEGSHVADAREYLDGTRLAALDDSALTRNLPSAVDAEETLWDLAQRTRMRPLVEVYLSQNPEGQFVEEAQRLLATLPAPEAEASSPELLCERLATHPRDATANTAGVPLSQLAKNAAIAIEACGAAAQAHPELPHYRALLARAQAAAGQRAEAIRSYRAAADQGDLRALVSLGLITETGDGVFKDPREAARLYEQAAEGGSPDGAINLAVALFNGTGVERDVERAVSLLKQASEAGSAIATFNLGALAQDGIEGNASDAIELFGRAAALGEPRAYRAAAVLLDEGRGTEKDPEAAADMLLRGVASDFGEAMNELTAQSENWSVETIRAVQGKLRDAGFYRGTIDGISGPQFTAALRRWRDGGLFVNVSDG